MTPSSAKEPRLARHERVIVELRERIAQGEWKPGERLPSFAELRHAYGVALSTIDRIYAVLEQEGLVVREQGKGIFMAEPRRSSRKGIIGLMLGPDLEATRFPYWIHLLEGIQSVAHEAAFEVLIVGPSGPVWEKMDGILVHQDGPDNLLIRRPLTMPAVALMTPSKIAPAVLADDVGGTREVVEYLLSLGHQRIGCMMFADTPLPTRRLTGYYAALGAAGIQAQSEWIRPLQFGAGNASLRELGRWNMQSWLQNGWEASGCTAILVQNDRIAWGVLDALREANIQVPQQVSVVGFDGTEDSEEFSPRLSSVQVPLFKIGAAAASLLLDQIAGREMEPSTITLPAHFQVRDTTGPVRKL